MLLYHARSDAILQSRVPVLALNIHDLPRESPLAVSMQCSECGCACSESSDPATADVIVHTELRLRDDPPYSDEEMVKISRYNPAGLRVLLSMESTYWRPHTRNATVLQHFDAVASYEQSAQLPLLYGPVPTEVPHFHSMRLTCIRTPGRLLTPTLKPMLQAGQRALRCSCRIASPGGCASSKNCSVSLRSTRLAGVLQVARTRTRTSKGKILKLASMSEYKMVFALENSICNDYATEKLYGPLLHGVVPVYLGAPNVADLVPDKDAIINLLDFADSRAAAAYLKAMLGTIRRLCMAKHHAWRKRPYTGAFAERLALSHKHRNFYCNLCSLYQEQTRARRAYRRGQGGHAEMRAQSMDACTDLVNENKTWQFQI